MTYYIKKNEIVERKSGNLIYRGPDVQQIFEKLRVPNAFDGFTPAFMLLDFSKELDNARKL